MADAVSTDGKEPFVYQAAKVAVWAPLIAIGLNCMVQAGTKNTSLPASVSILIGVVNMGFIVTGFVMAVVALAGIAKYGAKGLLGRGIVGLLLNGLFLASAVWLIFYMSSAGGLDKRLVGNWEWRALKGGETQRLELGRDKHFRIVSSLGENHSEVAGTWSAAMRTEGMDRKRYLVLQPESVSGAARADLVGKRMGYEVKEWREDYVRLDYAGEDRMYRKVN